MPEIRLNVMTGDWVIISPERATRPANPSAPTPSTQFPAHDKSCPFCKGNESLTPPETHRHQDSQGDWLVRCVPNKFPAVDSEGKVARDNSLLFRSISGVGQHEVIIETPRHNETVVWLNRQHFAHVLEVCRHRFLALYEDPRIEHVTLFKNHGREAGASLEHPHTQIVGLPVSPQQVRRRVQETLQHYDGFGHCLGCQMLQEEAKASVRVVSENDGFLCFVPYAALSPYHLWGSVHNSP